jgi:hypothetical protein
MCLKNLLKANIKSIVILVGNSQDFIKEREKMHSSDEKRKVRRRKKVQFKDR